MATEIEELSVRIADTAPFKAALRDLGGEADRFTAAIGAAFRSAVAGGRDFEDVLRSLAMRLAGIALDAALKPVEAGIGNALGAIVAGIGNLVPFAAGGAVSGGRVRPFAEGGVVAAPAYFPLGRDLGLMGEAGAEAVLPLARGSDGRLGVRSAAAAPALTVNFHVAATDAASFAKSEAQVTAMLARAVRRGRRGL